jgi:HEAT repeat protein
MRKILLSLLAALPLAAAVLAMSSEPTAVNLMKERQALTDEKKEERLAAIKRLGAWGNAASLAAPDLAKVLCEDPEDEVANQAALALAEIGPCGARELAKQYQAMKSVAVRERTLWALSKMGPEAREALPALKEALQDRHTPCRRYAAMALGELGVEAKGALPELRKALSDNDTEVRNQAAVAMANIGPDSLVLLRAMLDDEDFGVREKGVQALGLQGRLAEVAIPAMVKLLKDDAADVRAAAALALANMGPAAKTAMPHLLDIMKDPNDRVQRAGLQALMSCNGDDMDGLLEAFRKLNAEHHWAAPHVLKQFGTNPQDAIKPLIKRLEGKDDTERLGAALALAQIGKEASEAVPALRKLLKDASPQVQHSAAFAIAAILEVPGVDDTLETALAKIAKKGLAANARVQQFQQALAGNRAATGAARPVNRQALSDPSVQADYNTLVDIHVMTSVQVNASIGPTCADNKIMQSFRRLCSHCGSQTAAYSGHPKRRPHQP